MAYNPYTGEYEADYLGANDPNNPNGYYGDTAPPPEPPPSQFPTPIPTNPNPPPAATTPPAGQTADPWTTAPPDGNWQAWFLRNVQGLAANPTSLAGLEPKLTPHGITVLRNAQGVAGKIRLPNGQIVDVGRSFSGGDTAAMGWQWNEGTGGADAPPIEINPEYTAPYTETQPGRPDIPAFVGPGEFKAPTGDDVLADPSYRFRASEGLGALENRSAAKGTLNSGGAIKDFIKYNQNVASQEYSNVWDRRFANWSGDWANALSGYRANADVTDAAYDDAYRGWEGRRDTHYANQGNAWQKYLDSIRTGAAT